MLNELAEGEKAKDCAEDYGLNQLVFVELIDLVSDRSCQGHVLDWL
jgi:hypothetical protein